MSKYTEDIKDLSVKFPCTKFLLVAIGVSFTLEVEFEFST